MPCKQLGNIPIDVQKMNIDMLSLSGHKIYAPKGVGALYVKKGIEFERFIDGGHQEKNKRAGTENVPEIVALGKAAEIAEKNLLEMAKKEEIQNKKLMMYEKVIGFGATISFITLIFVTSFLVDNNIARIVLFMLAFILLIIGVSFALKIETETGYYECKKCHHKYVPKYSKVYFAMHLGTTRYMKCPKCNEKSWQRKILSK